MTLPTHPAWLADAAQEGGLALGYTIQVPRAVTFGHQVCNGYHSGHQALRAYARIEGAMRRWRPLWKNSRPPGEGRRKLPFFFALHVRAAIVMPNAKSEIEKTQ